MKYLIITSLYTSIIAVTTTQSELFPILFSTAGILLLYWFLSHSFAMRKEIAFLKEENQYFMVPSETFAPRSHCFIRL